MSPKVHSFLATVGGLGLLALAAFVLFQSLPVPVNTLSVAPNHPSVSTAASSSSVKSAAAAATTQAASSSSSIKNAFVKTSTKSSTTAAATSNTTSKEATDSNQAERIENPYSFPRKTVAELNVEARNALVNIFCDTSDTSLRAISGSGVLVDPRGIILTNAHVGQYVLLSERPEVDIRCIIRAGSPATAMWHARVLYMPRAWFDVHAREIKEAHPLGTGEHDYALLYITDSISGSPLPPSFPYVPVDSREAIGFTGDTILVAAYPAEFVGGNATRSDLYAASAASTIQDMLTFTKQLVDVISLGGIVLAQGGSSGGAVLNQWGQLIGIVVTTSEGATTAARDLRALTMAHIDRSLHQHTGSGLKDLVAGDPAALTVQFQTAQGPALSQLLMDQIAR